MLGYADAPEKTAEAMRDGSYRTGDTAQRDEEGYVTFVGRADDVFKCSDYRISPQWWRCLQAGAANRVRQRIAQDDLRKDPPGGIEAAGNRRSAERAGVLGRRVLKRAGAFAGVAQRGATPANEHRVTRRNRFAAVP